MLIPCGGNNGPAGSRETVRWPDSRRSSWIHHGANIRQIGQCLAFTLWTSFICAAIGRAAEPLPNVSATSRLPQGVGLAGAVAGDREMEDSADVIFADDFEAGDFRQKWAEVRDTQQAVLSLVDDSASDARVGRRSLKVQATLGANTGGGLTTWFQSSDSVFIRFYVKFSAGCDYIHHFCTLRANRGLSGRDRWSGFGGAGVRPTGDERFSTALEPWGDWGRWPPPGRWNMYTYWHEMSASPDGKFWGNGFRPAEQPNIERDRWICAEFMLRHNTPGQADGEQAFWIDGQLRGHWQGINWRTRPELQANALTLESYVTDRWTKQRVNTVLFDNVVIARKYIGPLP